MENFSKKVKVAREQKKLNQQQLADLVGVSKRAIAAYETTDTKPRGKVAKRLAEVLGVSLDYLLLESRNVYYGEGDELPSSFQGLRDDSGTIGALMTPYDIAKQIADILTEEGYPQQVKDDLFESVMRAYLKGKDSGRRGKAG